MRIAVAAHSAGRVGGVESYLADLIPALVQRGHDLGCWFESALPGGQPILASPHDVRVWTGDDRHGDPLLPLREWRPDVIYQHGLRSVALERQLTGIAPVVFFAHSYYGACISGTRATRFPVLTPCDRVFGPACLAHYFPRRCGGLSPATMVAHYRTQRQKERLLDEYAAVLVASRHMARNYGAQHVAVRVITLPVSRVDAPRAHPARLQDGVTLLYLGRLERTKGVGIALQAAARAAAALEQTVRLVVAGHGSLAAVLREEARVLMAGNRRLDVAFPGWLDEARRAEALSEADLLLMPSLWPEPFGLAGLEAAASGVPAIAFRTGGIEEWLVDGVTGHLVPLDGDRVQAFTDAICGALRDRPRLADMAGRARLLSHEYSMSVHLDALLRIFEDVVGRLPRHPHSA